MLFIKAFFFPLIGFFLLFFRSRFSRFSMTCAMRRTASLWLICSRTAGVILMLIGIATLAALILRLFV